jgi:hypothetical protein
VGVEVGVLKSFGRDARLHKKWKRWLRMWETLGVSILKLPEWMQDIVLEDVNTAVTNRIAVMEMIIEHEKSKR